MSWHDNHVHAIRLTEGDNGAGELLLDIDHILEWIKSDDQFRFRVQPAALVFHGVTFQKISIDYAAVSAGFGPFVIDGIERHIEKRERYDAQMWRLPISWPGGEITFEATGFIQKAFGWPVVTQRQLLSPAERPNAP